MTFAEIFSKEFLFAPTVGGENPYFLTFLLLFSLMIVFGILIKLFKKMDEKIRSKQSTMFLTVGIGGLVYDLAREVSLPWLGSRLFISLVFVTFFVWVIYLLVWFIRYVPQSNLRVKSREKFERYLPKPKKEVKK